MVLVIVLTSSIVAIAYLCVLPLILRTYSVPRLCWHFFYSHWNLILIVFHYYQAITTPPGYPPQVGLHRAWGGGGGLLATGASARSGEGACLGIFAGVKLALPCRHDAFLPSQGRNDIATVSICKKCIYPKPARTHHCSVCNRWVLALLSVNPRSGLLAAALGKNLDLGFGVYEALIACQAMCPLCHDPWLSGWSCELGVITTGRNGGSKRYSHVVPGRQCRSVCSKGLAVFKVCALSTSAGRWSL